MGEPQSLAHQMITKWHTNHNTYIFLKKIYCDTQRCGSFDKAPNTNKCYKELKYIQLTPQELDPH